MSGQVLKHPSDTAVDERNLRKETVLFVYEWPVRVWHWTNVVMVVTLCITGYLIGSPPQAVGGEAIAHYGFGWIRFLHFAAGQIMAVGFLFRFYWSFVGNHHAKTIFRPPVTKRRFWSGVWHELAWYAMAVREPRKYAGHNPLAIISMHVAFVWTAAFMIVTGFALYGEGEGPGWIHSAFTSWVIPLFGQSQTVHTYHHLGMWVIILFVMIHIYTAVREDIMSRQSLVSSMVSGWRNFHDDQPLDDGY